MAFAGHPASSASGLIAAEEAMLPTSAPCHYGPFVARLNPFRFSSEYCDDESGFLHYGHRYYNPSTGRWPSRDPIDELGFKVLATSHQSPTQKCGRRVRAILATLPGGKGAAFYAFVGNNSVDTHDWIGLVDCPGLAAAIEHMKDLCHQQIQTMRDLSCQVNQAENMPTLALIGDFLQAIATTASVTEKLAGSAEKSSVSTFIDDDSETYISTSANARLETKVALEAGATSAASEALQDAGNQAVLVVTGVNILNPADGVAEAEVRMAESLLELEYDTVKGLQSVLRTMMHTYEKECPCGKNP